MPTLLDNLETRPAEGWNRPVMTSSAERLRTTMAACRVSFTWWGVQRTLTSEQKAQAAQAFDAEGQFLSAGKKLLDTKHAAFRAVTAIRTKATDYWKGLSLPFPEAGIRLIKLESVEEFDRQMADYKAELDDAVANLDRHFGELKQSAAQRLGSLFNAVGLSGDAHRALRRLLRLPLGRAARLPRPARPGLYEREQERVRARFEEAVRLAEQSFLDQFAAVITHLTERITGTNDDGTPKVFRDSAVQNLDEFFDRFRSLNVRSNQQLDDLVAQAQRAVRNVGAQDLRDSEATRNTVADQLSRVQASLDAMLPVATCSSTGRGGGSSATRRRRGASHEAAREARRDGPRDLRRDDRPRRARPPHDHSGQPRGARPSRASGRPT